MKITILVLLIIIAYMQMCHGLSCYNGTDVKVSLGGATLYSDVMEIECPDDGQSYTCGAAHLKVEVDASNATKTVKLAPQSAKLTYSLCTTSPICTGDFCKKFDPTIGIKDGKYKFKVKSCSFTCCSTDNCNGGTVVKYSGKMMIIFLLLTTIYSTVF